MRWAWVVLLPIGLGGCFVPPPVAVASYAADGASYVASGKSVTDHGVSTVAGKDCATWHFFVGRAVCEDPNHPVAAAPFEQRGHAAISAQLPPVAPVAVAPVTVAVAAPAGEAHYYAVGTFSDRQRAERYAQRYAAFHPRLMPTVMGQRALIRVVLGPLGPDELAQLYGRSVAGYLVPRPNDDAPTVAQTPPRPASG